MSDNIPRGIQALDDAIRALAYVKGQRDEFSELDDIEAEAKAFIREHFDETKGERLRDHGIVVWKSERKSQHIAEIGKLRQVLEDHGLLEQYTTIDVGRVIRERSDIPSIAALIQTTISTSVSFKADTKGKA